MNIKHILQKSILELRQAGTESVELDAKILLEHSIQKSDAFLYSHPELPLTNQEYGRFRRLIRRRKTGEPIAYILGHKEFYGNDFIVNKNVLIPRPETEWLVERGIEFIKKRHSEPEFSGEESSTAGGFRPRSFARVYTEPVECAQDDTVKILDMGTGSGCIIISVVKELEKQYNTTIQQYNFYGAEIDKKAIGVAKKNAKLHKVDNYVKFYISDLFSNRFLNKKFDLITANLPYVPSDVPVGTPTSRRSGRDRRSRSTLNPILFEPQSAIFACDNGAEIMKKFLEQAKSHIAPKGLMLLELDPRNAKEILSFAKKQYPNAKVQLEKDLAGLDRYIKIGV